MSKAKMAINANPKSTRRRRGAARCRNLAAQIVHEVIVAKINDETESFPMTRAATRWMPSSC
ncbi:MAG: hypothetical protein U1E15_04550 [Hyphomicrobiales bacterium]